MLIVQLTIKEFDDLPNYSCSIPTGVIVGKRWKRAKKYDDQDRTDPSKWLVGVFEESDHENYCEVKWYEIQITITVHETIANYFIERLQFYKVADIWNGGVKHMFCAGSPDVVEICLSDIGYLIRCQHDAINISKKIWSHDEVTYALSARFPLDQPDLVEQIDEWLRIHIGERQEAKEQESCNIICIHFPS